MSIEIRRDPSAKMRHHVRVGRHGFDVDEPPANGGEDLGPTPHDLYDSALGACKALTLLWYARRKQIPLLSSLPSGCAPGDAGALSRSS